ncbi:MAG: AAA family ATPase [Candidatus Omnitrophota bacterium]
MYNDFYGFRENPFNVTSDPDFFFPSSQHEEAFSHLVFGIKQRKGILTITGEIGTGKTTLCRSLIRRLDPSIKSALILNPYFSEAQLLRLIITDLGIEGKFKNKLDLIQALNHYLLQESAEGNNVVLIIDEAQDLKPPQLEQIRLLSNLETDKNKLLQIILVGQPELLDKLHLDSLRQLNQRVSIRYHMLPLKKEETARYIIHRLRIASGCKDTEDLPVKFTEEAFEAVYHFSKGTPRLINTISDRALLNGFVKESRTIDQQIICQAARETT